MSYKIGERMKALKPISLLKRIPKGFGDGGENSACRIMDNFSTFSL